MQAVTWTDVKANIVVKNVASPVPVDPWEIRETSLTLVECDSGVHRSSFRTSEFDCFGSKQFALLLESDWYDLMNSILGTLYWLTKEKEWVKPARRKTKASEGMA